MRRWTIRVFLAALLVAASSAGESSGSRASSERTRFDHEGFTFQLPGAWHETRLDDGSYELRRGERDQVIVGFYPAHEATDAVASAEALSAAQQKAIRTKCGRGFRIGTIVRAVIAGLPSFQFVASCEDPRLVVAYMTVAASERVVGFEHYHYGVNAMTPSSERAEATIFHSMQMKTAVGEPRSCPNEIMDAAKASGGSCLDAAVLGQDVVAACSREFERQGWTLDSAAATAIGAQKRKKLVCYRQQRCKAVDGVPRFATGSPFRFGRRAGHAGSSQSINRCACNLELVVAKPRIEQECVGRVV